VPKTLIPASTAVTQCPDCAVALVSLYADESPWCDRCDWGLDEPGPQPDAGRFARWRDRRLHRLSARINRQLFGQLVGGSLDRPRLGRSELLLLAASALVGYLLIAVVLAGAYLIVVAGVVFKALGALGIAVAVLLRPRLGRVRSRLAGADELSRERAPQLFELLDRVAAAVGAPAPHHVLLDFEWNASVSTVGLRRRRLLTLGLPLWAVLRPQERVALLGHEFGHLVNGDLRRMLGGQLALSSFGRLAQLLLPDRVEAADGTSMSLLTRIGQVLTWPLMWSLAQVCWLIHLGANVVGARNGQRAEYYADGLGVRAGGSAAALSLADAVLTLDSIAAVVASRARGRQLADGWRAAAEQCREDQLARLPLRRQRSLREQAGLFAQHPPAGLRHRMIAAGRYLSPSVVLTEAQSALIDAELARYEESCRRVIAERG
jgi:heat shock protein HtpX